VSPVLLVILVFYSGLGLFKVAEFSVYQEEQTTLILNFGLFIYFNYLCFSKIFDDKRNNWILALFVVFTQLLLSKFFPTFEGYSGFLAFGFLIGRILGVYHPPVEDNKPLNLTRKILGWLALVIFVLCFSPNPII
jgi:uncharacterized membrane protein